jgi:hypothetical protein
MRARGSAMTNKLQEQYIAFVKRLAEYDEEDMSQACIDLNDFLEEAKQLHTALIESGYGK